jgi:hypothetical protein
MATFKTVDGLVASAARRKSKQGKYVSKRAQEAREAIKAQIMTSLSASEQRLPPFRTRRIGR